MLSHAHQRNKRLSFLVAACFLCPFQIALDIVKERTRLRIPTAHGRDDRYRRDVQTFSEAVFQDQFHHLGDVSHVRLIPVEIHAEPSTETRKLLRNERKHLRSNFDELRVGVERVFVSSARYQAHQELHCFWRFAFLLFEPMLAHPCECHDLGHAFVREYRRSTRVLKLARQPIGLRSHVNKTDENDVRVLYGLGELRISSIDMGIVKLPDQNIGALPRETLADVVPDARVEALDADDERDDPHLDHPQIDTPICLAMLTLLGYRA